MKYLEDLVNVLRLDDCLMGDEFRCCGVLKWWEERLLHGWEAFGWVGILSKFIIKIESLYLEKSVWIYLKSLFICPSDFVNHSENLK